MKQIIEYTKNGYVLKRVITHHLWPSCCHLLSMSCRYLFERIREEGKDDNDAKRQNRHLLLSFFHQWSSMNGYTRAPTVPYKSNNPDVRLFESTLKLRLHSTKPAWHNEKHQTNVSSFWNLESFLVIQSIPWNYRGGFLFSGVVAEG